MYSLYLYFLVGISTKYFKALVVFRNKKRRYTCIYGIGCRDLPHIKSTKERKKRARTYIIDKTVIEIPKKHFWLWVCIEPTHSSVLRIHISNERKMLVAEDFIRFLVEK